MMNIENTFGINILSSIEYTKTEKAIRSKIFVRWIEGITSNFQIESVIIHNVFLFGNRIGFIIAEAKAYLNQKQVPGIVFLRGDSVSIMPILKCENQTFTITVSEPRIPIASISQTGFPCGMVDDDTVSVAALKEFSEEVGNELKPSDLIDLGKFPISCGGSDEIMYLKAFELEVDQLLIDKLNLKHISNESEQIIVKVIKLDDVENIPNIDARSLLSKLLWDRYEANRKKIHSC